MGHSLVTGANRGIGLELVQQMKARGDSVVALCRRLRGTRCARRARRGRRRRQRCGFGCGAGAAAQGRRDRRAREQCGHSARRRILDLIESF